jgi:hypothetical protein
MYIDYLMLLAMPSNVNNANRPKKMDDAHYLDWGSELIVWDDSADVITFEES